MIDCAASADTQSSAKDAKKLTKILQKEGKTSDKELAAAIKGFGKVENEHKKATKVCIDWCLKWPSAHGQFRTDRSESELCDY